jgi:hypothetical protein
MNIYFRMIADRLMLKKLPEEVTLRQSVPDDDTRELIALMDHIPNARSVAAMYRKMISSGSLVNRFSSGDPAGAWLEAEQLLLDRARRKKEHRQRLFCMLIIFVFIGIASYLGGVYLLTRG